VTLVDVFQNEATIPEELLFPEVLLSYKTKKIELQNKFYCFQEVKLEFKMQTFLRHP